MMPLQHDSAGHEAANADLPLRVAATTLGVDYDSDTWDLSSRATTAGSPSSHRISFLALPTGLKNEVKDFVLDGLVAGNKSNGWAHGVLVTLRHFARIVVERHGESVTLADLSHGDGIAVEGNYRECSSSRARPQIALVAGFAAFARRRHGRVGPQFRPDPASVPPPPRSRRSYTEGMERVIPMEVRDALMQAVGQHDERLARQEARFPSGRLKSERLYLAVTVLLVATGRRISEILRAPRQCLREPAAKEEATTGPGIWFLDDDTKYHQGLSEAFVPAPLSDVVREYVQRTLRLTEHLSAASGLDRLFLTDSLGGGKGGGFIRTISAKAYTAWLNGRMSNDQQILRPGFIHRYEIKHQGVYYHIEPHQARHTRANLSYLGGAAYVDVQDDLRHVSSLGGLSPTTGVYIHGDAKDVERIREMNERRLVTGKAAPLLENRAVRVEGLDEADVAIYRAQGMVVQPTLYGH